MPDFNESIQRVKTSRANDNNVSEKMRDAEIIYREAMYFASKLPSYSSLLADGEKHIELLRFAKDQCVLLRAVKRSHHDASIKAYAAWTRTEGKLKAQRSLWTETVAQQTDELEKWKKSGVFVGIFRTLTMQTSSKIKERIRISRAELSDVVSSIETEITAIHKAGGEIDETDREAKSRTASVMMVIEELSRGGLLWESSVGCVGDAVCMAQSGIGSPERPIETKIKLLVVSCEEIRSQILWLQKQADFADDVAGRIRRGSTLMNAVRNALEKIGEVDKSKCLLPNIRIVRDNSRGASKNTLLNMSDIIFNSSGKIKRAA